MCASTKERPPWAKGLTARTLSLALVLLPITAVPESLTGEDGTRLAAQRGAFLEAERALKHKDLEGFHGRLGDLQDYPLYPYLVYQDLRQRLNDADAEEIEAFLGTYADTPLAPRLRRSWVKSLHREKRWKDVVRAYQPTSSTDSRCRYLHALYQTGEREAALVQVEDLWLVSYSQPPACDPIFDAWRQAGRLTPELAWARIRLAMNAGRPGLSRYLAGFLPADERPLVDLWTEVRRSPSKVLDDSRFGDGHEVVPEIVVYGVSRWARRTPEKAARAWEDLQDGHAFTEAQMASVQRSIGLTMARRNQPGALDWLSAIEEPWTNRRVRESRALVALRNGGWDQALAWMDQLEPGNRETERWQYWRARSLDQLGQTAAAMDIFSELAGHRDFYGFLAADRADLPYALNSEPLGVAENEVDALSGLPGIRRAHELYLLGRTVDARREWHHFITAMEPGSLPAAAALAHRWGWHDRAILTLGRTEQLDDLDLRFPLAFREPVMRQAKRQEIDPAWIFAVMRQESAFSADARSPAGAMGLMQLMPRTARQVARKLNTRLPSRRQLLHADTNIRLGSAYLRRLLDDLDEHAALATAAYNAGPHRVRSWLPEGSEMPADLWIESVPFSETHNYVRRVFAYTAIYEQRLGQQPTRLTQRLRPVPSRPSQASTSKRG